MKMQLSASAMIFEQIEDVAITLKHMDASTRHANRAEVRVSFESILIGALLIACVERLSAHPAFLCAIMDSMIGEHLRKWMVERHAMIDPFDEKQMRQLRKQEIECAERAERRTKAKERRAAKKAAEFATARAA
jgi:hypothetical protein